MSTTHMDPMTIGALVLLCVILIMLPFLLDAWSHVEVAWVCGFLLLAAALLFAAGGGWVSYAIPALLGGLLLAVVGIGAGWSGLGEVRCSWRDGEFLIQGEHSRLVRRSQKPLEFGALAAENQASTTRLRKGVGGWAFRRRVPLPRHCRDLRRRGLPRDRPAGVAGRLSPVESC